MEVRTLTPVQLQPHRNLTSGGRHLLTTVIVCVLASACAPLGQTTSVTSGVPTTSAGAPAPAESVPSDVPQLADSAAEVQAMLNAVAEAFRTAEPEALRPWLHDPDGTFGQQWLQRAEAMAGVPLTSYTLTLDTSGADLTTANLPGDGGLLVNVLEHHQLEGMDELGPVREHLFLSLRLDGEGQWTVAGDTDGEALGLVSADHLWDHGPVVSTRRGDVLALHHRDQPAVDILLDEASAAMVTAAERWPLAWPRRVPLLIPADQDELAELLHVTFELDNFIAFATTTPIRELGEVEMAGSRVLLNTGRFLERPSASRERILVHELVHAASRPSSAPDVPSWLEEGVAQALGERQSTTGTRLLSDLAATDWTGALPLDAEFSTGGRDDIFLSYQRAWSFVDWLVAEHGAEEVGRFYEAVGRGSAGAPGTVAAKLDQAAVARFGAPLETLLERWRATL